MSMRSANGPERRPRYRMTSGSEQVHTRVGSPALPHGQVSLPFYRWSLAVPRPVPGSPATLDHIGYHILKRRLDLGLPQNETARRLGVHPGGLENWEHGRTVPADRFMPAVIRFLAYNPSPAPRTLGERVGYERVARGWSRKRLAAAAAVDEATVRRIEADMPRLAHRCVGAVLKALGIRRNSPIVSARRSTGSAEDRPADLRTPL